MVFLITLPFKFSSIVVAAPVGALLIGLLGPRLLTKSGPDLREEERNQQTEEEIEEEQWFAEHPDEVVRMGGAVGGADGKVVFAYCFSIR